jgi:hypothetical protein
MATLGPNDLKQYALPSNWDATLLTKLALESGETYEQLINDITSALALQNGALLQNPVVASLCSPTTERVVEYSVGVSNGFQDATEYGMPDAKRASVTGHMLPLYPKDRGFGWTWQYLQKARRSQIDADVASGMADMRNLYHKAILTRLFKSTYDAVSSGKSCPIADGGTADSTYVPPMNPDRATAFAYTHTHLGRLDGITQANLETGVAHVWEHGYDAPYDLLVAQADVGSWRNTTNVTGFVANRLPLISYGDSETLANAGADFIGVVETAYGTVRVRASARIPTKYWAVYKSFGVADQRNPLKLVYNARYGVGAILLAGANIRQYPLETAILYAELGVGVGDRVAAYICYNHTTGSYTDPTIV